MVFGSGPRTCDLRSFTIKKGATISKCDLIFLGRASPNAAACVRTYLRPCAYRHPAWFETFLWRKKEKRDQHIVVGIRAHEARGLLRVSERKQFKNSKKPGKKSSSWEPQRFSFVRDAGKRAPTYHVRELRRDIRQRNADTRFVRRLISSFERKIERSGVCEWSWVICQFGRTSLFERDGMFEIATATYLSHWLPFRSPAARADHSPGRCFPSPG